MYYLVIAAVILCFLFKVLNVNSYPEKSLFYCSNAKFLESILKTNPSIAEPYLPTRLWGYSGHVQTVIQGIFSRIICPLVDGHRCSFVEPDGATVTFDVYQPLDTHFLNEDITLALCPGICNSSESVYIRRVVYQAQFQGYRIAVLNHLGVLKNVPLTSPRIFCYGNTSEYGCMVSELARRYPNTKFICIGFSMGGNIVTKYLGEERSDRPDDKIIAGISACQGYDGLLGTKYMLEWENCRRLYFFIMTENMRAIMRRWQKQLFPEEFKKEKGIIEKDIWSAGTIVELDEAYTRKAHGYDNLEEFYRSHSCCHYFNGIKVPMIFINAADDPIIPPSLLDIIKKNVETHDNFLYIEQKYGGHLGFYEGGLIYPNSVTWLDKHVVNLSDALVRYTLEAKDKSQALENEEENFIKPAASLSDEEDFQDVVGEEESVPSGPRFVCTKRLLRPKSKKNILVM